MVIVLDILNPSEEPENKKGEKPRSDPRPMSPDRTKLVRKQVISITGEIVEVDH